jgi:glycosyltransferase involved in cell wall biosynthesis
MQTEKAIPAKKQKMLVAVDSLMMGGIAKSLAAFAAYCRETCDIDVLIWRSSLPEEVRLPAGVNRICLPGTESVRTAYKSRGVLSRGFAVSLCGALRKKRWLAVPRIRKAYDIAIAYSHVSNLKYYVIDRVRAKRKYAFYHHGAYTFPESVKRLDAEYYPRYDRVFAVSEAARTVLREAFPALENVSVLPNLIDIEGIRQSAKAPCPEYPDGCGIRLLTVGRLSPEKDPLRIVETAKLLDAQGVPFRWIVVGDGELAGAMKETILENGLREKVIPVGNQENPYRFMGNCDCYVQFSRYEADPLTVKEAAVLGKPMALTGIPPFRDCSRDLRNVTLFNDEEEAASLIRKIRGMTIEETDPQVINRKARRGIDALLHAKPAGAGSKQKAGTPANDREENAR